MAMPAVGALSPYQPGKPIEELQRELGVSEVVKLASNENPLGPPDSALRAIADGLSDLSRYPDANGFALKARLARHCACDAAQITLGNGSNDVLDLIARCFLGPGRNAVFSEYAFLVYPLVTQAVGAQSKVAPPCADGLGHDLDAILALVDEHTRVVFIANPNNPTGSYLRSADLKAFIEALPSHVVVVVDEAYHEYVLDKDHVSALSWIADQPNLIVTRTFSKAWGLAGLRMGYSVSHPTIADLLNRLRQPFNGNSLALAAAEAVLDDRDYLDRAINLNTRGMAQLRQGLEGRGFGLPESAGNFLCIDLKRDAMPVFQALLKAGVIVRPVANYGLPSYLRVSIGSDAENARFLEAFAEVTAGEESVGD